MSKDRWQKIESLFIAGVEMPPRARADYWKQECGADREMLAELEQLLNGHQRADEIEFMDKAIWSLKTLDESARKDEMIGKKIGDYEIIRLLGKGGMGDVYLAKNPLLDGTYVIKVVKDEANLDFRRRFLDEIRVHQKLVHENIVNLRHAGLHEGMPYLVMDYFESQSLRNFLLIPGSAQEQRALPAEQVLDIAKQLAAGLGYAHQVHKMTHRDIKPENILVQDKNGLKVKVIDFGLAILPEMAMTLLDGQTHRSSILAAGTPVYMSPEQYQNGLVRRKEKEVDARSDIYSLGLVIYEMLTGQMAYPSERHRAYPNLKWPSAMRRYIPAKVDAVLKIALQEDPDARYQSAQDLARALETALSGSEKPPFVSRRALAGAAGGVVLLLALWIGGNNIPGYISTGGLTPTVTPTSTPTATPTIPPTPVPPVVEDRLNISLYLQNLSGKPELVSSEMTFRNTKPTEKSGGLRVAIEAAKRGYIYILEQADAGKVNILYPDRQNPAGFRPVAPGEKVIVPKADGWLRFRGEPGTDVVYILFVNDKGDPLFEPVEAALKREESSLDVKSGSELLVALQRRADELAANSVGNNQELQQTVKGAGALVGVLKLKHQQ